MQRNIINSTLYYITLVVFSSLSLLSCSETDDIDSIFNDKTWYMTGVTINGNSANGEDIKLLYKEKESFYIHFNSNNTFSGKLDYSSNISGKWNADGKNQKFIIQIETDNINSLNTLSLNIYTILKNVKSYSGDINNVLLQQDKYNYINLTTQKP